MKGKKDILSKKGFYVVLYSCIGAVLVSAGVIAYTARDTSSQSQAQQDHAAIDSIDLGIGSVLDSIATEDVAEVGQTDVRSYQLYENEAAFFRSGDDDTEGSPAEITEPQPSNDANDATSSGAKVSEESGAVQEAQAEDVHEAQEATSVSEESYEVASIVSGSISDEIASIISGNLPDLSETTDISSSSQFELGSIEGIATGGNLDLEIALADPVFSIFGDDHTMAWPIAGDIVMDFSMDRTIFDVTLQQFRTSDSISIQAEAGEVVRAAAEGIVREITNTRTNGISVVVDHGNGWVTTYSQLDEYLFISEGDVLLEGQRIGVVGEPSIHRVLLGDHLGFAVKRNGVPHDPNLVLAER